MDWHNIEGWFDEENYKMFMDIALPPNPVILESGTFHGKSTWLFSEIYKNSEIHTCDILDYKAPLPSNATFHHCAICDLSWDKPIDLLFIDDSHLYEDCQSAFNKYEPFIKKGGYIAFHDYANPHVHVDGVRIFCHELGNGIVYDKGEFGGYVWQKK